jgi:hypothetical protein
MAVPVDRTTLLLRLFSMQLALEQGRRVRFEQLATRTLLDFDRDSSAFANPAPMRDMLAGLAEVAWDEQNNQVLDRVEKTRQYCMTL